MPGYCRKYPVKTGSLNIRWVVWLLLFLITGLAGTVRAANVSGVSASPNPFTPPTTTTISYSLTNPAILWLRIYDNSSVLQRKLVTPASYTSTNKSAGANSSVWDGKNDAGTTLGNGTYPYRIDNVYFSADYTGVGSNPQDVAVNPANTQIIWQLNKTTPYVYKSTNGGTNWSSVNSTGADAKAYGIAIDSTGNQIYIANNGQSSLRKSTDGGTNWAASGTFPGSVTTGFDVATDSTGNIVYVQDYSGNKVYKSTNGGTNWSTCTATGLSLGIAASGVAADSTGNTVIVADSGNNRLFKSTDGCATFSQIAAITAGTAAGQVSYPYQVSIQSDGSFWVSERDNHRIQHFDSNGNSLMVVGGTSLGTGNYQFDAGAKYFGIGLATISGQPHIFIADYNNTRVKKLGYDNWSSATHLQIGSPDITAPAAVSNLSAPSSTATGVTLNWTAPGDDDTTGTAAAYDVRYSTSLIDAANWSSATQATGEPSPQAAGSAETFTVAGLTCNTTYYLALKTSDEVPNTSGLSNVISKATAACPAVNTGMAAYGDTAATGTPKYRVWNGTDFGAEGSAQNNVSQSIRYTVLKEAPTRTEYMMGNVHADGKFYVQRYNGSAWSYEGTFNSTNIGNGAYRYFDIAYEQASGKALVAYEYSASSDRRIYYQTWNGTAWSAVNTLDYSGLASSSTGVVYWVKLIPKANSDQVLLVFSDDNWSSKVYAYVWNGSSFVNGKTITINRTASVNATEVIAGAWEAASGDAIVLFGDNNNGLSYATFSSGSWSSDSTAFTFSSGQAADYIAAAGDPVSDYVGVITVDRQPKVETHVWTGAAWEAGFPTSANFASLTATAPMPISVAWQNTGGKALFGWTDSGVNKVDYVTYTTGGAGWSSSSLGSPSQTTTTWANKPINMVQLVPDPAAGSTKIMLTGISANSDVKSILWDNGAWTQPTTYNYESSVSSNAYQAAMYAWDFSVADTTPPGEVTGFTVSNPGTGNRLDLTWANPGDADFAGVKIVRNSGATAPANCSSGTLVYDGTGTSNTDTGVTDGTQYSYRICSYDGTPNYSTGVTGSGTSNDVTAPADVSDVTAAPGSTQIALSWSNPGDVDFAGTKILRKTGSYPSSCTDGTATVVYTGAATSYTDTVLTNGTTYYYRLCAYDEVPNYPTGATISAAPYADTTPPAEVSSFTVMNPGTGGKLNLGWDNPADADFSGVKIVRATGSTAPANCSTGTTVYNSNSSGYVDPGLTNGVQYSYRACAYDTSGNYSTGVTGTNTPTDTTAPANVTGLSAIGANTQVTLSWTNPSDADFAGTKILRRTDTYPVSCADASATTVYMAGGPSYVDIGLTNGTTYYYRVCSYDTVPNYSSGVTTSAVPGSDTTPPAAVSNLAQSSLVYTRGANLTWTAPGDDDTTGTASSYDFRYTDALDYPANVTSTLMDTNWGALTQAASEPAPQAAGSSESLTIADDTGGNNLSPNTLYYFVMKTTDDFGNVSGISNVVSAHTALKYGYNTVSIPYKASTGTAGKTLNDLFGDDVSSVWAYTWQPSGMDSGGAFSGGWVQLDASTNITSLTDGMGYYMYAYAMNSSVLDENDSLSAALVSQNSDGWTRIDLSQGRNLLGNPYLKNVNFSNVKICQNPTGFSAVTGCTGGTTVSFSQAVTNGWLDGNIAYYANSTTYTYETCNAGSCTAKLRPWWGQWVYLLDGSNTYKMAVPKP